MKNHFELVGRVSLQPKLIITKINQIPLVNLNIAVTKRFKQSDGTIKSNTEFFVVYCWNNVAKYVADYIQVGDLISVEGFIRRDKDFDIQKNTTIYRNELICEKVQRYARSKANESSEQKKKELPEQEKKEIDKEIQDYKKAQISFDINKKTDEIELKDDDLPF